MKQINNVYTAMPEYYGVLAFSKGSKGQLVPVSLNTNGLNLTAYGILGDDKKLYVTLINKDQSKSATVTLDPGQTTYKYANAL